MSNEQETPSQVVKTLVELDFEFLSDVMVTAFDGTYGGVWYWCEPCTTTPLGRRLESAWEIQKFGVSASYERWMAVWIKLREETGDDKIDRVLFQQSMRIDHKVIAKGMQMVLDDKDSNGNAINRGSLQSSILRQDAGDIDSEDADVIVQLGAMGEVIFG
jgi:hypothetical protein